MKKLLLLCLCFSSFAHGARVLSARIDESQKNLLIDVSYPGGCVPHHFTLKMDEFCMESYPVQCSGKLVEEIPGGEDTCNAIIYDTVRLNLEKNGLDKSYYNGAILSIRGERSLTGNESEVEVSLPWKY